jgi:hypothetical protein
MAQVGTLNHENCGRIKLRLFFQKYVPGFTIEDFNDKSKKSFDDLYREIMSQNCILYWDTVRKRIVRCAHSVKLIIRTPDGFLLEVARHYENKDPNRKIKLQTISGTKRRGRRPDTEACLEAWQEGKLRIKKERLLPIAGGKEITDEHDSSVYYGVLSLVRMYFFYYEARRRLKRLLTLLKDVGTTVELKYFKRLPAKVDAPQEVLDWFATLEQFRKILFKTA